MQTILSDVSVRKNQIKNGFVYLAERLLLFAHFYIKYALLTIDKTTFLKKLPKNWKKIEYAHCTLYWSFGWMETDEMKITHPALSM